MSDAFQGTNKKKNLRWHAFNIVLVSPRFAYRHFKRAAASSANTFTTSDPRDSIYSIRVFHLFSIDSGVRIPYVEVVYFYYYKNIFHIIIYSTCIFSLQHSACFYHLRRRLPSVRVVFASRPRARLLIEQPCTNINQSNIDRAVSNEGILRVHADNMTANAGKKQSLLER